LYFLLIKNIILDFLSDEEIITWTKVVPKYLQMIEWLNCNHNACTCTLTVDTFPAHVKELVGLIRELNRNNDSIVTPYLHCLIHHVPTMIRNHGSLRPFSTSAQELKNSIQTLIQFRASNQHNVPLDLEVHQIVSLWFSAHPEIMKPLKRTNIPKFEVPIECKYFNPFLKTLKII
jgi:hypothetical protein